MSLKASVSTALRCGECSVNRRVGGDDELTERRISSAHTGARRVWHQLPLVDRVRAAGAAPGPASRSAAPHPAGQDGLLAQGSPRQAGAKKEAAQEEKAVKPNKCRERQVPVP